MNIPGALYIVATPIGNLSEITYRAVNILRAADFIIAEDTRVSYKLLANYDIKKRIVSCHKDNEKDRSRYILNELFSGRTAALISDAGTPCVSDPGHMLVREAAAEGINVISAGGTCAVTAALSISGFDLKSFAFYGFPPRVLSDKKNFFDAVQKDSQRVAVFYESPLRIVKTLEFMKERFSDAAFVVCNDISKKFEKIYRGNIFTVIGEIKDNPLHEKGEYTVVAEKGNVKKAVDPKDDKISAEAMLFDIMIKNNFSIKEAVEKLAAETKGSLRKKDIYSASLVLKNKLII